MTPCPCPPGPCEHYPHPATPRLAQCRAGTSGLPRWQEVALLEAFARFCEGKPPGALPCVAQAARPADAPCVHRGAVLRAEGCPTCRGNVRVKVFGCAHPVAGPETTLARCRGCPHYTPPA